MVRAFSQTSVSMTWIPGVIVDGEREWVRVEEDSRAGDKESRVEKKSTEGSKGFGLSLPVGPLPRGGRSSGGHPTIFLRRAFSSSSSSTRCSRAYLQNNDR